jgi:hypothetical protein
LRKVNSAENRHFLDGPYARIAALACFALAAGALAYIHRDDLVARQPAAAGVSDDAFSRCFREGTAAIETMLSEKSIGEEQARLFRLRAEARCRAQTGTGGPPGQAPGLPAVQ